MPTRLKPVLAGAVRLPTILLKTLYVVPTESPNLIPLTVGVIPVELKLWTTFLKIFAVLAY